jgi:glycerol dehydrogenase-like iron-containing ADH family enzyme
VPAGIVCLVAIFPFVEPTFGAAHLLTDVLDFVTGEIASHGLLAALHLGSGHIHLLLGLI